MRSPIKKQVLVKKTGERGFVEKINEDKTYLVRIPLPDSPYPKWLNARPADIEVPSPVDSIPDSPF